VRIGFRTNVQDVNLIDLFVYAYDDKIRMKETFICSVKPLERFSFKIQIHPENFVVGVNGLKVETSRTVKNASKLKYRLFPYYGGNQTAKKDMHIMLARKK
jgi:hypothetical protein